MSFIKRTIGPDETLIGITSAHWIYGFKGLMWLAGMMIIGLVLDYYATGLFDYLFMDTGAFAVNRIADALFWVPTALGVVMFFLYFLMMIAPEIGLTSKRIIYKRGIIFVDVKEVDLEEIKAADVDNGYFGRFLNYGYVVFDARFVTGMDLPAIGYPYRFVKALNQARSKLKQDSMTIVLEGGQDVKVKEKAEKKPKKKRRFFKKPAMEQVPHDAVKPDSVKEVVQEAGDNLESAVKNSPMKKFRKKPREEEGPVVFDSELLQREKRLREKIKDNFSSTH